MDRINGNVDCIPTGDDVPNVPTSLRDICWNVLMEQAQDTGCDLWLSHRLEKQCAVEPDNREAARELQRVYARIDDVYAQMVRSLQKAIDRQMLWENPGHVENAKLIELESLHTPMPEEEVVVIVPKPRLALEWYPHNLSQSQDEEEKKERV